jgi:hypothetical protein
MSEKLELLIGKHIKRIEITHDYLQLLLVDGSILNIFNTHSINDSVDSKLAGYEIVAVKQDEEVITFSMSPEGTIQVGLKDSDYHGPEAMEYIREHGPCVVWP